MSSWRLLFKKRKLWAEGVLVTSQTLAGRIRDADAAAKVMQRAVAVAFSNLESHSTNLGGSLTKLREWADRVIDEREKLLAGWEPAVRQLLRIPVLEEFRRFGDGPGGRGVEVLAGFFDVKEVQGAAAVSAITAQRFEKDVRELGDTIEDICTRTLNLKTSIQQGADRLKGYSNVEEQLANLLEEVDVFVAKVRADNEFARGLQGPKSASMASKRAYTSTSDYLPNLTAVAMDLGKLLAVACERKVRFPSVIVMWVGLSCVEQSERGLPRAATEYRRHTIHVSTREPADQQTRHTVPGRGQRLPVALTRPAFTNRLRLAPGRVRPPP